MFSKRTAKRRRLLSIKYNGAQIRTVAMEKNKLIDFLNDTRREENQVEKLAEKLLFLLPLQSRSYAK